MQFNYIFMFFLGWKVLFHPFYISLTEIRYNPTDQSLEIAQKIFWDDLEIALGEKFNTKVDFLNPKNKADLDKMVQAYLLEKSEIKVNGIKVEISYLGYEIEEEAAWFYLEAKDIPVPKKVEIKNEVLISNFESQQNIINFYLEKSPKSLILYKDNERGELVF
ncbi:DUF6702 family protein [Cognataquiflexum rubidum]|uniref:DUF6702 family protein n=1 Tax=Cognataquiflexum rubidum TaxID=2922273 RepID=UPI001F144BAA|nr:DUF6702 family protein [Cognataquiflexum rubidum]MCH6233931.1 hypothetical protein [Cognataquiflexum rubidum]